MLLVLGVGPVLEPELVVGRVWLVAELVIDEVDDGALLVHVLQGVNHATDDAKGIVGATYILKGYLGADGRKGSDAATRDILFFGDYKSSVRRKRLPFWQVQLLRQGQQIPNLLP